MASPALSCFPPQGAQMRRELASLPVLRVPKLTLPKDRQEEEGVSGSLYRRTSHLLETLYQMSASAKVVDITRQRTGEAGVNWEGAKWCSIPPPRHWAGFFRALCPPPLLTALLPPAAASPAAQLLEQTARLKQLSETIEKLKVTPAAAILLFLAVPAEPLLDPVGCLFPYLWPALALSSQRM